MYLKKLVDVYHQIVTKNNIIRAFIADKSIYAESLNELRAELNRLNVSKLSGIIKAEAIFERYEIASKEYNRCNNEDVKASQESERLTAQYSAIQLKIMQEEYSRWSQENRNHYNRSSAVMKNVVDGQVTEILRERRDATSKAESASAAITAIYNRVETTKKVINSTFTYLLDMLKHIPAGMCLAGMPQACTVERMILIADVLTIAITSDELGKNSQNACDKLVEIASFLSDGILALPAGTMKTKIVYIKELLESIKAIPEMNICKI